MFPPNPNVGDRITLPDGRVFEWNGERWVLVTGGGTGGGDVTSVFGRTGVVVAWDGDYFANEVTNAVDTTETYDDPAWLNTLAWSKITNAPAWVTVSAMEPATPTDSVFWFDTASRRLLLWVTDEWIEIGSPQPPGGSSAWDGRATTWDGGATVWD